MTKIITGATMSLDGYIAGPNDMTIELWEPADPDPYDA